MKVKKKIRIRGNHPNNSSGFTLIELIVAMAVFSIIMLVMISFFGSAQEAWTRSTQRSMIYENAKIAMDMISRDLQGAIYSEPLLAPYRPQIPFWHWRPANYASPTDWVDHTYGGIAFVGKTYMPPNDASLNPPCEVKYELAYPGSDPKLRGWLRRSVTGKYLDDNITVNPRSNYATNFFVGYTTNIGIPVSVFTAEDAADAEESEKWQKVIPYVTKLTFTCYDSNGKVLDYYDTAGGMGADAATDTDFPAMVMVKLSLLDKNSWYKWIALGGNLNAFSEDASASGPAYEVRKVNERTFTKMIFLNQ